MFGLKCDWSLEPPPRYFTLEDYQGGEARWCPGCGDFAILTTVQRICREENLLPEKTVCVSGIGCSSRFPHYMSTYGFHGIHGRPLPVACGIKSRRPDLTIWVATGDGDCCSIGAGHWLHAVRYNMDMTVLLFDNGIYGLTKKQTSPTTPIGYKSNTHPKGSWLPPLNPTAAVLGMTNASFVAQTVDWNPLHLYATVYKAYQHRGFSFVRIMQRCPTYTNDLFSAMQRDPSQVEMLTHERGVPVDEALTKLFKHQTSHDPSNLAAAQAMAQRDDKLLIGLFYQNPNAPCYDDFTKQGMEMKEREKLAALEKELDRFSVSL